MKVFRPFSYWAFKKKKSHWGTFWLFIKFKLIKIKFKKCSVLVTLPHLKCSEATLGKCSVDWKMGLQTIPALAKGFLDAAASLARDSSPFSLMYVKIIFSYTMACLKFFMGTSDKTWFLILTHSNLPTFSFSVAAFWYLQGPEKSLLLSRDGEFSYTISQRCYKFCLSH